MLDLPPCPECDEPAGVIQWISHTPEAEVDFMGNRAVCSVRTETVAVRLGCGHVMRGYHWTQDRVTWRP